MRKIEDLCGKVLGNTLDDCLFGKNKVVQISDHNSTLLFCAPMSEVNLLSACAMLQRQPGCVPSLLLVSVDLYKDAYNIVNNPDMIHMVLGSDNKLRPNPLKDVTVFCSGHITNGTYFLIDESKIFIKDDMVLVKMNGPCPVVGCRLPGVDVSDLDEKYEKYGKSYKHPEKAKV